VFLFPGTDHISPAEPAFRSKPVGAFILRTYQADVSIQYGLAETERLNYKSPAKMSVGSLSIIMCLDDWSDAKPFILRGSEDCQEKEELLHPTEWKSLCDAKSSFYHPVTPLCQSRSALSARLWLCRKMAFRVVPPR
jgi:hypothetical protein